MHALATRWLAHPGSLLVIVAMAMTLALSTLRIGFFADDYAFVAALDGVSPQKLEPTALYDFASGNEAKNQELMRRGPFPWWTAPDLKVRFFRPLSSVLLSADHAIFGHYALGYHLQGLAWFLAFLLGVGFVFRAVMSPEMAGWSFLPFAVSAYLVEPVGWASNRHMLVAGSLAFLGLAAHVFHRERQWGPGRWLSVPGLALGLSGGEAAVGVALYWIAYEMVGAPEAFPLRLRARRALVPGAVLAIYLVVYKVLDYGAAHTDAYCEPLSSPLRFGAVVAERAPILLGQLFAQIPAGMAVFLPRAPLAIAGTLLTLLVAAFLGATWSAQSPSDRRALRWLSLGGALSLVASAGAMPGSRLLLMPSVGAYAVMGALLAKGLPRFSRPRNLLARVARRAGWGLLFAIQVVLSPVLFVASTGLVASMGQRTLDIAASLDGTLPESIPSEAPSVFLIASDPMAGLYVGAARALLAPHYALAWCMLSMARSTHRIRRPDPRTLVITADAGMLHGAFETAFRGDDRPLRAGDEVALEMAHVKVLAVNDGHPTSIEVVFKTSSLEDPRLRILVWMDGRLQALRVPEGGLLEVPWSPGPMGML